MSENRFPISSPRQLKDWINNMAKRDNLVANTVLQNYMMERFLERVSASAYQDNFILKGGFLIAAMVGIDVRSTMDIDTTIRGVPVNQREIERIIDEIIQIPIDDNVCFSVKSVRPIHEAGEYEDFRFSMEATFFTMRVSFKIDITTGDVVIPKEIDYSFQLMFEERSIQVKAYNLNTILAEKIESILARNVANTRARDFYDIYILFSTRGESINKVELYDAVRKKAEERGTSIYLDNWEKYLQDIKQSDELLAIWTAYQSKYAYANGIAFADIVKLIEGVFVK